MITLISGSKNCGKTAYLLNWYKKSPIGIGVLSLKSFSKDQQTGYNLLFLPDKTIIPLCSYQIPLKKQTNQAQFTQGAFLFYEDTYRQAEKYIGQHIKFKKTVWIDEVGEIELKGKGFYSLLKQLIYLDIDLNLGVRLSCLNKVCKFLIPRNFKIILINETVNNTAKPGLIIQTLLFH